MSDVPIEGWRLQRETHKYRRAQGGIFWSGFVSVKLQVLRISWQGLVISKCIFTQMHDFVIKREEFTLKTDRLR